MSGSAYELTSAVTAFLESCDPDYEFPAGGCNAPLSTLEERLLLVMQSKGIADVDKFRTLSNVRKPKDCYSIVIFGVRLAILSVRRSCPIVYHQGVIALAAGSGSVDYRDLLGAFSIFENCGDRLNIRFQDEMAAVVTDDAKLRSTLDGYFSRPSSMRTTDVMGFVESGQSADWTFRRMEP